MYIYIIKHSVANLNLALLLSYSRYFQEHSGQLSNITEKGLNRERTVGLKLSGSFRLFLEEPRILDLSSRKIHAAANSETEDLKNAQVQYRKKTVISQLIIFIFVFVDKLYLLV